MGHARVSPSTVSDLNKKILRDDRGVAQSSDRGRLGPLCATAVKLLTKCRAQRFPANRFARARIDNELADVFVR